MQRPTIITMLAGLCCCTTISTADTELGACCWPDPDLGTICQMMSQQDCHAASGYFYGVGTGCNHPSVECEEPAGACCVDDPVIGLHCQELTGADCFEVGGFFYGAGTNCTDTFVECDPPPVDDGACCWWDGIAWQCMELEDYKCEDVGGTWYGPGVTCNDPQVLCPPDEPLGACCLDEDGDGQYWCIQTTQTDCSLGNGYFYGSGVPCSDPIVECETPPIEGCLIEPGAMCAGRPNYADSVFQSTFGDTIAVQTASPQIFGGAVLTVFDLSDTAGAPLNSWFALDRWSHASWTQNTLGSIFGLAVDGDGAIYVTATRSWWWDIVGPAGWGGVYRVDPVTGSVSTFASLPNTTSGLGNIAFDCGHGQFFVTNFEDGKIYRLDMAGLTLDTWDPGAPFNGLSPVSEGDRPFAVEVHDGRLYWSMWNEHQNNPSSTMQNEIWSIELDSTGACMPGTEVTEIALPAYVGSWSSPVSDIRFSPRGTMLLAERTVSGIEGMGAHDARLLEYECVDGAWIASANSFDIGGVLQSSAGGVGCTQDRNWVSADAMHLGAGDNIYGMQGIPSTGGSIADSILIDYQDNLTYQDKTLLGDLVVVPAATQVVLCPHLQSLSIECQGASAPWEYDLTIGVSNMDPSASIAQVELAAPSGMILTPDVFAMNLPPQHSWSVNTLLAGAANGEALCLDVTIKFASGAVCQDLLCLELPVCTDTLPGDIDGDWIVDINDLLLLLAAFGQDCPEGCPADIDGNGAVGVDDLLTLMANWS